MDDDEAPFKDDSDESDAERRVEDENMCEAVKERDEIFNSMSKYEIKLMKGFMRGFANMLILWLISKKRQHGYEIMSKLHESNPYENKMPSASKIYPVLHDLEKNGLIKGSWEHHGKRKVKYYEITSEGKKSLLRFRKLAQHAHENRSSLWMEFMEDMTPKKDNNE